MAAPAQKNIRDLNGSWAINQTLSDPSDPILKLQGVNWLIRRVLKISTITLHITQTTGPTTNLSIISQPSNGLPSTTENRVLDWAPVTLRHALLGNIRGRSRWCSLEELEDAWLRQGWEEGTKELMHFYTQNLDFKGLVTQQVVGFAVIEGCRRHVRRVLVTNLKGERVEGRLVYDFLGNGDNE